MYGEIDRGCGRCGRTNYTPAGEVDGGPPILRYCLNCIKVCRKCGTAFKLDFFWPIKDSEGFKNWSSSGRSITAMSHFMLPGDYGDTCRNCQQYQQEPQPEEEPEPETQSPVPELQIADTAEALRAQYEAIRGRKL